MTSEEWNKILDDTLHDMKEHVEPFLSPIWKFRENEEEEIFPHGTGSYIEKDNEKFIITNDHVAKKILTKHLTHSFYGSEIILILQNKFLGDPKPVDVAISKIDNSIWQEQVCAGNCIPLSRFDLKHDPIEGELLFFAGFSGERSNVVFGEVFSRGTPYLTQEFPIPKSVEEANLNYHISIPYSTGLARSSDPDFPLPDPHGFSGSLLWNTKRIECLQKGIQWHPSMAKVTGIIWGWPSSAVCILATKVECLELESLIEAYANFE